MRCLLMLQLASRGVTISELDKVLRLMLARGDLLLRNCAAALGRRRSLLLHEQTRMLVEEVVFLDCARHRERLLIMLPQRVLL